MTSVVRPLTAKTMERVLSSVSESDRILYINDRLKTQQRCIENHLPKYPSNAVHTGKYTLMTLIPKNLMEQFRRVANVYFLLISILQLTTPYSPTNKYSTIGPLVIVLLVTMIKEAIEDKARHEADARVNSMMAMIWKTTSFEETRWQDLHVGDIVQVQKGDDIPADMLMILSSNGHHAHVETSNLDGESNAKMKCILQLPPLSIETMNEMHGQITCDAPNSKLVRFDGVLHWKREEITEEINFTLDHVLLRGTSLRHTHWIIGIILATGPDTKLLQNFRRPESKFSQIDYIANRCICVMITTLLLLVTASAVAGTHFIEIHPFARVYLNNSHSDSFLSLWVTYLILYNNLVPISLYVTLEVVKWYQAKRIEQDKRMQCPETQRYVKAMTSNINEDLGQINYLFTDKTGTLTANQMVLRASSIADCIYDHKPQLTSSKYIGVPHKEIKDIVETHATREMLRCMLLCHTASFNDQQQITSSSPDEVALLEGCLPQQCAYLSRIGSLITIMIFGHTEVYTLLTCNEFDSQRRCMSVVVQREGNEYATVYCKGADAALLVPNASSGSIVGRHVHTFACLGLRTLIFAYREVPLGTAFSWLEQIKLNPCNRERYVQEMEDVTKLTVVGATGVEDRLQPGVSNCLRLLSQAGMRIWMLTGDKDETAIALGHACGLVSIHSTIVHINGRTLDECLDQMTQHRRSLMHQARWNPNGINPSLAVVVNGFALNFLLDSGETEKKWIGKDPTQAFMELATQGKAVIACRLSPAQKAMLVDLVKLESARNITLAIGDGGNDVSMIQAAHVGVGIFGKEGLQAVRSADFGLAQFHFLAPLLLLHGRWNHRRIMHVVLFILYKNVVLVCALALYSFFTGFSGQTLFDSYLIVGWNVLYTCAPVFVFGIIDEDIQAETILQFPMIYQEMEPIHIQKCILWLMSALVHSISIVYMVIKAMEASPMDEGGVIFIGTFIFWLSLLAATFKASLTMHRWHRWMWWHLISLLFGILTFVIFVAIYSAMYIWCPSFPVFRDFVGLGTALWNRFIYVVLISVIVPLTGVLPDIALLVFQRLYFFSNRHVLQEIDSLASSSAIVRTQPLSPDELSCSAARNQSLAELMQTFPSTLTECGSLIANLQRLHATNRADPESDLLDAKDVRLHPTKLEFVGKQRLELEREFDASVVAQERHRVQLCVLVATGLLLVSILVEYFVARRSTSFLIFRLVVAAGALTYALFTSTQAFASWYHVALLMPMAISGILMSATITGTGYISAVLFPIVLLTVLHVRFTASLVLVCLNYIIYASIQVFRTTLTATELGCFTCYIVFVIGYAAHGAWRMQKAMRIDFLQHRSLAIEERRTMKILSNVFPAHVVAKLKAGENIISETEPDVTILFCDVVELPTMLQQHSAAEVVSLLDHIFSLFDEVCVKFGVQKMETVGRTYMACAGLQENAEPASTHPPAMRAACLALELLRLMDSCRPLNCHTSLKIRIGLHSGRVISGLVGRKKQQFSLFGDTVNTASRMQSTGVIGACQVSEATYERLKLNFQFTSRNIFAKGKGEMTVYLLGQPTSSSASDLIHHLHCPPRTLPKTSYDDSIDQEVYPQWLHFRETAMEDAYINTTTTSREACATQTVYALCLYMIFAVLRDTALDDIRGFTLAIGLAARGIFIVTALVTLKFFKHWQQRICWLTFEAFLALILFHILSLRQNRKQTMKMHIDLLGLDIVWVIFVLSNGGAVVYRSCVLFNGATWLMSVGIFLICYIYHHDSEVLYPIILTSCTAVANITISRRLEFFNRRTLWLVTRTQLETKKADQLLYQRLPQEVVYRMKQGEVVCDEHLLVGILYSDIQGFTALASKAKTEQVIQMLDSLFASFDQLTDKHGLFKLQTIGDAYVIMSGLPYVDMELPPDGNHSNMPKLLRQDTTPRSPLEQLALLEQATSKQQKNPCLRVDQHLQNLLQMALDMIHTVAKVHDPTTGKPLQMRIGIHLGNIYGGVIGNMTLRYDMWGADAMIANEIESNGVAGRVVVSESVKEELEEIGINCIFHKEIQHQTKTYIVQLEPGQVLPRRSSPRKATSTVGGGGGSPGKLRKGY